MQLIAALGQIYLGPKVRVCSICSFPQWGARRSSNERSSNCSASDLQCHHHYVQCAQLGKDLTWDTLFHTPACSGWFPARPICKYLIGRLFVAHGSFHQETILFGIVWRHCWDFAVYLLSSWFMWSLRNARQIWAGKVCSLSTSKSAKLIPELSAFPCLRKDPLVFKVEESCQMPQQFRLINYDRVHTDVTLHMKKKYW